MVDDRRSEMERSAEHVAEALRAGGIALRREDWGTLRVTGPDRATWLNGIVTCDVTAATPERGAWGLLLSKQGKIEAELQVLASEEALLLGVAAPSVQETGDALDRYLVMEDAEVEVLEGSTWWELHGPRAAQLALEVRDEGSLAVGALSWTLRGGAAVLAPSGVCARVEAALEGAGALLLRPEDWEPERVRLGLPRYGVDYDGHDNPHAAGLERRTVSWSKGCYLGQEVVCMQDMRGKVKRRLVRLELEDAEARDVRRDSEVTGLPQGEVLGRVTSRAGKFALASLKASGAEPGARVVVGDTGATVLPLEFLEDG